MYVCRWLATYLDGHLEMRKPDYPAWREKKERKGKKKKSSPPLAARTSLQRLHTEVAAS